MCNMNDDHICSLCFGRPEIRPFCWIDIGIDIGTDISFFIDLNLRFPKSNTKTFDLLPHWLPEQNQGKTVWHESLRHCPRQPALFLSWGLGTPSMHYRGFREGFKWHVWPAPDASLWQGCPV